MFCIPCVFHHFLYLSPLFLITTCILFFFIPCVFHHHLLYLSPLFLITCAILRLQRKSSSSGVEGGNSGASGNSSVGPGGGAVTEGEAGGTKATPDPLSPSRNKEWTKFVDSPTSTLSSPGLKPVNFDFQKSVLEQDPKILHPKAVRLTPESKRLEVADVEGPASFSPESAITSDLTSSAPAPASGDLQPAPSTAPTGPAASQGSPKKTQEGQDIKPIQRPLPRKPTGLYLFFDFSRDAFS
ncbi:hypothetical protein E2C01_014308 [Portunus trituberculatus]|uniref:Uncharacterized protein n=1 Tax=Portunus trituberculatus TaxID=210409 RepID=A0A5B7DJK3_PORTR|nr:hypothetical protein [Portunus trituberculatus]